MIRRAIFISSILSICLSCDSQTRFNVTFDASDRSFLYSSKVIDARKKTIETLGYDTNSMTHMYDMQFYTPIPSFHEESHNYFSDYTTTNIIDLIGNNNLTIEGTNDSHFVYRIVSTTEYSTNAFNGLMITGDAKIYSPSIPNSDLSSIEISYLSSQYISPQYATNTIDEGSFAVILANGNGTSRIPLLVGMIRDSESMPWEDYDGHTVAKNIFSRNQSQSGSSYTTTIYDWNSANPEYNGTRTLLFGRSHYLYLEFDSYDNPSLMRHFTYAPSSGSGLAYTFIESPITNTISSYALGPQTADPIFSIGSVATNGVFVGSPAPYSRNQFLVFSIRTYSSHLDLSRCAINMSNDCARIYGRPYRTPTIPEN